MSESRRQQADTDADSDPDTESPVWRTANLAEDSARLSLRDCGVRVLPTAAIFACYAISPMW
jgi:hypothetical protein